LISAKEQNQYREHSPGVLRDAGCRPGRECPVDPIHESGGDLYIVLLQEQKKQSFRHVN